MLLDIKRNQSRGKGALRGEIQSYRTCSELSNNTKHAYDRINTEEVMCS